MTAGAARVCGAHTAARGCQCLQNGTPGAAPLISAAALAPPMLRVQLLWVGWVLWHAAARQRGACLTIDLGIGGWVGTVAGRCGRELAGGPAARCRGRRRAAVAGGTLGWWPPASC